MCSGQSGGFSWGFLPMAKVYEPQISPPGPAAMHCTHRPTILSDAFWARDAVSARWSCRCCQAAAC